MNNQDNSGIVKKIKWYNKQSWFGGLFCERIICNFVFGKNVRFCHFSKVKKIKMFNNELKCLKVVDMTLFNILINTTY